MFRRYHVILHSDYKKYRIFQERNLVLKWIELVNIKISLLLDGTCYYLQSPRNDKAWNFRVFFAQVLNQRFKAFEWRVKDSCRNVCRLSHVQQTSNCSHGPAPESNGGNLRSVSDMLDYFVQVILLIETQRHIIALGITTSTKIKGTERNILSHKISKVLHSEINK